MMLTYVGLFAGAVARTFVPYLVALKEDPMIHWNSNFLKPAFAGLILSAIITLLMAAQVQDIGFLGAFTLAYTMHSLSREVQKITGF